MDTGSSVTRNSGSSTIAAAIAAAVLDGASTATPKVVVIEGGRYTGEVIPLSDGIYLVGLAPTANQGAGGVVLVDPVITSPAGASAGLANVSVQGSPTRTLPLVDIGNNRKAASEMVDRVGLNDGPSS